MYSLLNKYISKWKGQPYRLDPEIPGAYLFRVSLTRLGMIIRGKCSGISNKGLFFFSWKAKAKCRGKIRVGRSVTIDSGSYVDALSLEGIWLGNNVNAGKNTKIMGTGNLMLLGKGMKVGNNVGLGTNGFYGCAGGIDIGDDTIIGDFVSFHAENHNFSDPGQLIRLQGVTRQGITVGKNCWIGAKVTILDGVIIEEGCVIAAGAVLVAGTYPANGIYGGVPARLIKNRLITN